MDGKKILKLCSTLDENIDDLEDALGPLLKQKLDDTTSKLPVLERAKLNVLVTYAIESLIFSVLRLNGENAKAHPVFEELARVKQYFAKIDEVAKGPPQKRENLTVNKDAAGRIVRHALAGNDKLDREQEYQKVREDAIKSGRMTVFEDATGTPTKKRPAEADQEEDDDNDAATEAEPGSGKKDKKKKKNKRRREEGGKGENSAPAAEDPSSQPAPAPATDEAAAREQRKAEKQARRAAKKSNKPPKSAKDVFKELVSRDKGGSKNGG